MALSSATAISPSRSDPAQSANAANKAAGQSPEAGQAASSQDDIKAQLMQIIKQLMQMIQSQGGADKGQEAPAGGGQAPAGGGQAPAGGGQAPAGGGQAPAGGGQAPAGGGQAPAGGGQAPAGGGQWPSQQSGGAGSQAPQSTQGASPTNAGGAQSPQSSQSPSSAPASGASKAQTAGGGANDPTGLGAAINKARAAEGLGPVTVDPELSKTAKKNDDANISTGKLDHHFGAPKNANGEITFQGSDNPDTAVNAWLNSPGHRAIMMDPDMKSVGVSMEGGFATADLKK